MDSKRGTADQKVKDAIGSLHDAVQILPEALNTIDRELDEQYAEKARIESAPILLAEARKEATREIESARVRARENLIKVAARCSTPAEFRMLPTEHEMSQPAVQMRLLDLLIFSGEDNLKSIFADAQMAKDWSSDAIGKEDRAARIAVLEKSIMEKEVAREALAVKFAEIKIFVDRRPGTDPGIVLEFDGGKWNREKFSRLAVEFHGMQGQVRLFDEELGPLVRALSESERQLSTGDFRFAPQQKAQLETPIKGLKSQILDLRQRRADLQKRLSDLNEMVCRCQQFLGTKGIDSELRL